MEHRSARYQIARSGWLMSGSMAMCCPPRMFRAAHLVAGGPEHDWGRGVSQGLEGLSVQVADGLGDGLARSRWGRRWRLTSFT